MQRQLFSRRLAPPCLAAIKLEESSLSPLLTKDKDKNKYKNKIKYKYKHNHLHATP